MENHKFVRNFLKPSVHVTIPHFLRHHPIPHPSNLTLNPNLASLHYQHWPLPRSLILFRGVHWLWREPPKPHPPPRPQELCQLYHHWGSKQWLSVRPSLCEQTLLHLEALLQARPRLQHKALKWWCV